MGFRAEDVGLCGDQGGFEVEVTEIYHLGESTMVHTKVCSLKSEGDGQSKEPAANVLVRLDPDTNLVSGNRVKLFVDPNRVLWFDSDSGENLLKDQK